MLQTFCQLNVTAFDIFSYQHIEINLIILMKYFKYRNIRMYLIPTDILSQFFQFFANASNGSEYTNDIIWVALGIYFWCMVFHRRAC